MSKRNLTTSDNGLPAGPVRESAMPPYRYQDERFGQGSQAPCDNNGERFHELKGVNLSL
jgi:hypothetical protein